MLNNLFSAEVLQETLSIVQGQFLLAFWETLYAVSYTHLRAHETD